MPTVAVIGASTDPSRYSHQAVLRFAARGYVVWPVHPAGHAVAGHAGYRDLAALPGRPDVITVYVNPTTGAGMAGAIAAAGARLVILNPGADGEPVTSALAGLGVRPVAACSLVLLAQGDPLTLVQPGMR
jgi:predicted CoA-binding protein